MLRDWILRTARWSEEISYNSVEALQIRTDTIYCWELLHTKKCYLPLVNKLWVTVTMFENERITDFLTKSQSFPYFNKSHCDCGSIFPFCPKDESCLVNNDQELTCVKIHRKIHHFILRASKDLQLIKIEKTYKWVSLTQIKCIHFSWVITAFYWHVQLLNLIKHFQWAVRRCGIRTEQPEMRCSSFEPRVLRTWLYSHFAFSSILTASHHHSAPMASGGFLRRPRGELIPGENWFQGRTDFRVQLLPLEFFWVGILLWEAIISLCSYF